MAQNNPRRWSATKKHGVRQHQSPASSDPRSSLPYGVLGLRKGAVSTATSSTTITSFQSRQHVRKC